MEEKKSVTGVDESGWRRKKQLAFVVVLFVLLAVSPFSDLNVIAIKFKF